MAVEKSIRLAEFYRRLTAAPNASSHDEAFLLIDRTMNQVEDEMSGIPFDPARSFNDGRLYPPSPEFERESKDPGVRCYAQRRHRTYIGSNGAIEIRSHLDEVIFSKTGS